MISTLHWVLDQETALKLMRGSLKDNGTLLILTYGKAPNNLATLSEKIARSFFPAFKQERVYFTPNE